jgi:hypothetical protein
MSFLAYKQYSTTSFSGGYASSAITGPLNSSQTPLQMATHNHGVLTGLRPNPPQFYPSDGASEFSNSRHQYLRTASAVKLPRPTGIQDGAPSSGSTSVYNADLQKSFLVSQSTKYIAPQASSLYLSRRKSEAVGKSSYKQGLPLSAPLSYKNYNNNDVKTHMRRARSSGSVAPVKKGSIYNTSLATVSNHWGAGGVRATY